MRMMVKLALAIGMAIVMSSFVMEAKAEGHHGLLKSFMITWKGKDWIDYSLDFLHGGVYNGKSQDPSDPFGLTYYKGRYPEHKRRWFIIALTGLTITAVAMFLCCLADTLGRAITPRYHVRILRDPRTRILSRPRRIKYDTTSYASRTGLVTV